MILTIGIFTQIHVCCCTCTCILLIILYTVVFVLISQDDEDVYILSKISDTCHSLFGTHKEEFLPMFEQLLHHFVKLLVRIHIGCIERVSYLENVIWIIPNTRTRQAMIFTIFVQTCLKSQSGIRVLAPSYPCLLFIGSINFSFHAYYIFKIHEPCKQPLYLHQKYSKILMGIANR